MKTSRTIMNDRLSQRWLKYKYVFEGNMPALSNLAADHWESPLTIQNQQLLPQLAYPGCTAISLVGNWTVCSKHAIWLSRC